MFKTVLTGVIALVTMSCIAQATELEQSSEYVLSISEVRSMNKKERSRYFKSVAKALVYMSKQGKRRYTFIDLLLTRANASTQYRCIGGGVPVAAGQSNCGASSYAGFSCQNGYEICNPLIFGLKQDGQPVCYRNATTRLCYQNIVTGRTTSFDHEKFNSPEVQAAYAEFSQAIDEICSGRAQVQESSRYRDSACQMVQRQTQINRQRQIVNWQQSPPARAREDEGDRDTLVDRSPRPVLRPDRDTETSDPEGGVITAEDGVRTAEDTPRPAEEDSDLVSRTPIHRGDNPCSAPSLTSRVPLRENGTSGSQIRGRLADTNGDTRDCQLLRGISDGSFHIPSHLGQLVPITMGDVTICVMPDYLSVGSDTDNVRVPLGSRQAIEIAREMGFILPTTAMVDTIYSSAEIKIPDQPRGPPRQATTTFFSHDQTIDRQLGQTPYRPGNLVAGHKKDLVLNLLERRTKVSIYGWHRDEGGMWERTPHTAHGRDYADYSHGIRLVSQVAFIDGRPMDLRDLLEDGRYSNMLNSRGLSSNALARFTDQETRAEEARGESCFENPTHSSLPLAGTGALQEQ